MPETAELRQQPYAKCRPMGCDTFLLGIGAQKSGTTWLHKYLSMHPQARMPDVKELHFFDSLYLPNNYRHFNERAVVNYKKWRKDGERQRRPEIVQQIQDRVRMTGDVSRYFDLFYNMKLDTRVSGDITPTYCALPAEDLRFIRRILMDFGLQVRVVFLMRDPIERAFSAARMWAGKHGITNRKEIVSALFKRTEQPSHAARGRYHETVHNLRAVFEPQELHLAFFENLFQERSVQDVCSFLGIDYVPAKLNEPPNATVRVGALTPYEQAKMYYKLADVYSGCLEIFGDDIPESWAKPPRFFKSVRPLYNAQRELKKRIFS